MVYNKDVENGKYKLLGFEKSKNFVVIMVVSIGRVVKVKLADLLKSEIIDDLSKVEVKEVCRKFYSVENTLTVYDVNDRH